MSKKNKKSKQNSPAGDIPNPIVSVRDLHKSYKMGNVDLPVLHGVNFDIAKGEFITLYGHSGSGKSTLLHLIGLLDKPSQGKIIIDSQDVATLNRRAWNKMRCEKIGFVFQFFHLFPELSVLENTLMPGMIDSSITSWVFGNRDKKNRAIELLSELGLENRLKHKPKELSGGERQRVAIARALINSPKLLLADEPTGNLDSRTGDKIMDVLTNYNKTHGQTIIMVTHDQDYVELADRSLYLKDGRLINHPI